MKTTRKRIFPFEASSVLLFAALSIGSVTALHAQTTQVQRAQPAVSPAATAPAAPSKFIIGPGAAVEDSKATAAPTPANQQAFDKADTDHNGKLSRKEAAAHGLSGNKFQQWDKSQNGSLSREEFDQAGK